MALLTENVGPQQFVTLNGRLRIRHSGDVSEFNPGRARWKAYTKTKSTGLSSRAFVIPPAANCRPQWHQLKCRVSVGAGRSARIEADDARLVGAERALAALAIDARYRQRSIGNRWCSAARRGCEVITALHCRVGENLVNEASIRGRCIRRTCARARRAAEGSQELQSQPSDTWSNRSLPQC